MTSSARCCSRSLTFLLREVFDYGYDEISQIVDKSEPNCRQIFVRARKRIDEGKPRFETDRAEQREGREPFRGRVPGRRR
jgi:predicted RNA polymerase sigma factor